MSHPTRVRGLKQDVHLDLVWQDESHPTRVRGLKLMKRTVYERGEKRCFTTL